MVSLNVGGQVFTVKRETLCVCRGSFLADLFSGRWEGNLQKDQKGNIFLDIDPAIFDALLAWLRDRKIESPDRPAAPPRVAQEDLTHFQAVVDYLGLRDHVELPEMGPDGWSTATTSLASITGEVGGNAAWSLGQDASAATPAGASGAAAGDRPGILEAAGSLFASFRGTSNTMPAAVPSTSAPSANSQSSGSGAPVGGRRPVGWSNRNAHPAAIVSPEAGNVVSIGDTRSQASAAAVRATRGFQQGEHYWEVKVLSVSDYSYVGFVSAEWSHFHAPVGRAPHSWGFASNGNLYDGRHDGEASLPVGYGNGSTIGWLLQLGTEPLHRTASVFVDGRLFENLFAKLPETLYPAVSNMRAAARYSICCDAEPPPREAWIAQNAGSSREAAAEASCREEESGASSFGSDTED